MTSSGIVTGPATFWGRCRRTAGSCKSDPTKDVCAPDPCNEKQIRLHTFAVTYTVREIMNSSSRVLTERLCSAHCADKSGYNDMSRRRAHNRNTAQLSTSTKRVMLGMHMRSRRKNVGVFQTLRNWTKSHSLNDSDAL